MPKTVYEIIRTGDEGQLIALLVMIEYGMSRMAGPTAPGSRERWVWHFYRGSTLWAVGLEVGVITLQQVECDCSK